MPAWLADDEYSAADVSDPSKTDIVVQSVRPDVVFMLAGVNVGTASDLVRVNTLGTVGTLEAVRRHAPDSIVIIAGSAAEYGTQGDAHLPLTENHVCSPRDLYGMSKLAASEAARSYHSSWGVQTKILRLFNVVGAGMPASLLGGALLVRIRQAMREGTAAAVRVGRLDTYRDFVSVADVAEAMMMFVNGGQAGQIYNVCSGQPTQVRKLADGLIARAGGHLTLVEDASLVRADDAPVSYGSNAKANLAVGFSPRYSLCSALDEAWQVASAAQ